MGSDRLIYFRTDGNSKIASGHLVRCLSIASACQKLGMEARFLVSDADSAALLTDALSAPFPVLRLTTAAYDDPERELAELLPLLNRGAEARPLLFLDSYFVTEKYLTALRQAVKTAYLDDLQLFDYPVDLLINYDVIPTSAMPAYQTAYQRAKKTLLGSAYTPLRSQFLNREMPLRQKASHVLVTTGASDPHHFCLSFLNRLQRESARSREPFQSMTFHVVAGSLNRDTAQLFALAQTLPGLQIHQNVADMAALMESCDLAVSASGTTLYELCALGVPTISYTMADNQLISARAFAEAGAIDYAGDIRTSMEESLTHIFRFLTQMSQPDDHTATSFAASFRKRKSAHESMRRLIDGNGSARIAAALLSL